MTKMIKWNVKIKKESDIKMDETKTVPYSSPTRGNCIDDSEKMAYASPRR